MLLSLKVVKIAAAAAALFLLHHCLLYCSVARVILKARDMKSDKQKEVIKVAAGFVQNKPQFGSF